MSDEPRLDPGRIPPWATLQLRLSPECEPYFKIEFDDTAPAGDVGLKISACHTPNSPPIAHVVSHQRLERLEAAAAELSRRIISKFLAP